MSRPSDWKERERARDPLHSYIVQAPAGSGKTELLTQRMLELLARVDNPEEVVAITFTRKAAAEMRHRLIRQLQAAAEPDDGESLAPHQLLSRKLAQAVLQRNRERDWDLLETPSRLRIRTIDSLCGDLARQLPVLSGLGGGQKITKDATALYRMAATRTMAAIEDHTDPLQTDVVRVLDRYDNQYDKLVDLLTYMLASREQWLGHLVDARTANGFDRHGLESSLRYLVETQLESTRRLIPDSLLAALPAIFSYNLENQPVDEPELRALLAACAAIGPDFLNLPSSADSLAHWNTMIARLLTADGGSWRKQLNQKMGFAPPSKAKGEEKARREQWKQDFTQLLDPLRGDDRLREALQTIRLLPSPAYEDEAWESLQSLMRLMLRAAEEFKLVLAETGELDFSEIANRAIQALGDADAPSDLALRMDYRIRHLLVDEFQDTSNSQIQLLNQLTAGWTDGDGRSLFLVGDPMQSIYRFRKAEVSLFISAWEGRLFTHIQLTPLQLRVNFRSNQPVVDWVNQIFPRVMPGLSDPVRGAVRYSEASSKPAVSSQGYVESFILPDRDDREEARLAIELIGQCDPEDNIAILVRSRSHARTILTQLDRLKDSQPRFRYQAIEFNPLAKTTLIRDLVALTLALCQPADRLSWLATLRAPYIGLELADMDRLAGGDSSSIILDAISACCGPQGTEGADCRLSDDGRRRLQRAGSILQRAFDQRGRLTVRSMTESCWLNLGGPACVESDSELEDARTYFDLLESLEAQNLPVDHDTLDQQMENLYAQPDAGANGKLQVMTIYSAKGLQFDTVILPGLNREPGSDKDKLLHWFELAGEQRIVMSPMRNQADKEKQKKSGDLIQYISSVEKDRRNLENGRLLYVAATRAIRNLYLFAALKPNTKREIKAKPASLMAGLWPAIQDEYASQVREAAERLLEAAADDPDQPEEPTALALPQEYRRLAANWCLPAPPDSVQISPGQPASVQDYIEFSWAGEARLTGNLVHRLLQLMGEQGLANWQASGGMEQRKRWCRAQLASEGVRENKADGIINRASRAINNCLVSEHGKWILDQHQDSHCEFAITTVLNGQVKNLVLDRSFVDDGCRWIIDYKTSSHTGGDLEGFLNSEIQRYGDQLRGYRKAMAFTEPLPIRTALYFPLLDRFCEIGE